MFCVLQTSAKNGIRNPSSKLTNLQNCLKLESVRHYKKPRWLPIAKSKMYKNIVFEAPPKYETEESKALYATYKLYARSLWEYQDNISREHEIEMQKAAKQVSEEVELERIFKINEAENERVRKNREAAVMEEWNQIEQKIIETRHKKEEEELKLLEENEEEMEFQLERLKHVIKLEDLDAVIEKALAYETDYNYAISKDGKYYHGRYNSIDSVSGPPPEQPIQREASK